MSADTILINARIRTMDAARPRAEALAIRDGRIKRGQTLMLAAFGAGLTSGGVLLKY